MTDQQGKPRNDQIKTDQDEFDAAFDETTPHGKTGTGSDGAGGAGGDDTAGGGEGGTDGDAADADGDKGKGVTGDGDDPAHAADGADPAADDQDPAKKENAELKGRLDKLEQTTKSWEGRLSASDRRNNELTKERDDLARKVAEYEQKLQGGGATVADVDAELEKLKKEYPDFTGPMWAVVERALKRTRADVDKTIDTKVQEAVKPIQEARQREAVDRHLSLIAEKHPDFREIAASEDLKKWVDSKPAYLRPGLQSVLKAGTADQVIALLTDYKAEVTAKADADKKAKEDAAKAKLDKKVSAASAVKPRPGGVPATGTVDENDFDGAWDEANKT